MISIKRKAAPRLEEIVLEMTARNTSTQVGESKAMGYAPLVFYNGVFIASKYIQSFELNCTNFVPELRIMFQDKSKVLHNEGFALDNTIISVYLDSRTKDVDTVAALRPIRIDFKISQYNFLNDDKLFYVVGILNADALYTPAIFSMDATSYEVLDAMAARGKLGFASNITNTNDKMVWLNADFKNYLFIQDVTANAYLNDTSFFFSFVDFYYNLNFIDVQAQFMDTQTVKGIHNVISKGILQENSMMVQDVSLITKGAADGLLNNTIASYEVNNASTSTSLNAGYRTELYYYDKSGNWGQNAGTFVCFTLESLTEGTGVVLKSNPGDRGKGSFYQENVRKVYESPLETLNMHPHYSYAATLNELNLMDMHKLTMTLTLTHPNFNLYKYQQLPIYVMDYEAGRNDGQTINRRLTGNWLIVDIQFTYENGGDLKHHLTVVRRELGR